MMKNPPIQKLPAIHTLNAASVIFLLSLLVSCTTSANRQGFEDSNGNNFSSCAEDPWSIPCNQVVDGGPGKDGIPSIDEPQFSSISDIELLEDWELVLVIKKGNQIKAYPNVIMYYHEIVNDIIGDEPMAITYCPLTGSGIAWERTIGNTITTFGVSGLIHKNNLIPYDRNTNSNWSQMLNQGVNNEFKGASINTVQLVEMTWGTLKEAFPDAEVLNTDTGFGRNYDLYLYGDDYPQNNERVLFPIYNEDPRLERKELVHGIKYNLESKAYPVEDFSDGLQVIQDNVGGNQVVLAGSSDRDMVVSFERTLSDGTILDFTVVENDLPVIMEDQEGTRWNFFGEAISGPREGEQLKATPSYNAYWFAWADFFPNTQLGSIGN